MPQVGIVLSLSVIIGVLAVTTTASLIKTKGATPPNPVMPATQAASRRAAGGGEGADS